MSISEIKVNSDDSKSNFTETPKSVTINIISEDSNTQSGNNEGNQNSGTTNNNNVENQKPNTSNNNNAENQNLGSTNKDNNISISVLPKTGDTNYNWIIAVLGISAIIVVYSLIRIRIINKKDHEN